MNPEPATKIPNTGLCVRVCDDAAPGTLRLALHGELDLATAAQLERAMIDHVDGEHGLEFDLSGLRFIDSTGVRVLLSGAAPDGQPVRLHAPTGQVREVLARLGLLEQLTTIAAQTD